MPKLLQTNGAIRSWSVLDFMYNIGPTVHSDRLVQSVFPATIAVIRVAWTNVPNPTWKRLVSDGVVELLVLQALEAPAWEGPPRLVNIRGESIKVFRNVSSLKSGSLCTHSIYNIHTYLSRPLPPGLSLWKYSASRALISMTHPQTTTGSCSIP